MTISLCTGQSCTRKESCLRYLNEPLVRWQAYLCEVVLFKSQVDRDDCKYFFASEDNVELVGVVDD